MRKLATIRKIHTIEAIPGADLIEIAKVDGWQCVVKKSEFKIGDLGVYFEIDSFLPVRPEFEFLRKSSYKKIEGYGEGFRLKTIRLRGTLSQGLLMPLASVTDPTMKYSDLQHALGQNTNIEGTDVTDWLGVRLWDPPLNAAQLSGNAKGYFPSFVRKTDAERVQNLIKDIQDIYFDQLLEVTMKLDGSSMTVYCKDGKVGVCSRNYELKDDGNTYWEVAKASLLDKGSISYWNKEKRNLAFQGELMGPGIQGNQEKFFDHRFYLFRIWDIDNQRYLPYLEYIQVLNKLRLEHGLLSLRSVPYMGLMKPTEIRSPETNLLESFLRFADGPSINTEVLREGVVWKHIDTDFSFKVISNKWLLNEK